MYMHVHVHVHVYACWLCPGRLGCMYVLCNIICMYKLLCVVCCLFPGTILVSSEEGETEGEKPVTHFFFCF